MENNMAFLKKLKTELPGTSLVVQWLGLSTSTTGGQEFNFWWGN